MRLSEVTLLVFYSYNIILLIGFTWLLKQFKFNHIVLFLSLIFFQGMFCDLLPTPLYNVYKIIILVYSVSLLFYTNAHLLIRRNLTVFISFILFCLYFLIITLIYHNDPINTVLSQLSKYIVPFCLFFIFKKSSETNNLPFFDKFFTKMIVLQILFCISKIVIIGDVNTFVEGWVGSLTGFAGGAAGTTFPILALFYFGINNRMRIDKKFIYLILGLLFIGFATGKRAIWFIFPLFFFILYYYYNPIKRLIRYLPIVTTLLCLFVYLGFRLIPSLNPDKKVWGKFELEYTYNYALRYSTGIDEDDNNREVKSGVGRVGAVSWMIDNFSNKQFFYGLGINYIVTPEEGNYSNSKYYMGVHSRGSITGIVGLFMTYGVFMLFIYFLYLFSLFFDGKMNALKFILFSFVLFDYIFYVGTFIASINLSVFTMYLINKINYERKKEKSIVYY